MARRRYPRPGEEEVQRRRGRGIPGVLVDLRPIIGGLFTIYGAVCLVIGLTSFTPEDAAKSGGVNVNLWAGVGMLVLAAVFLTWSVVRPVRSTATPTGPTEGASSA